MDKEDGVCMYNERLFSNKKRIKSENKLVAARRESDERLSEIGEGRKRRKNGEKKRKSGKQIIFVLRELK